MRDGDLVSLQSRVGEISLHAKISERMQPGRRLHDVPSPQQRRQCRDDGQFGLGDQLPRIQGHGGAGAAHQPLFGMAGARPRGRNFAASHRGGARSCRRVRPPLRFPRRRESIATTRGRSVRSLTREIAVETPIEIAFGGAPFAVMMATPPDIEDFAIGFALTEGIIEAIEDIRAIEAAIDATSGLRQRDAFRRAHGRASRPQARDERAHRLRPLRHRGPRTPAQSARAVCAVAADRAGRDRRRRRRRSIRQPLNARDPRGPRRGLVRIATARSRVAREDVGRHNALDKLIGALLREKAEPDDGFVVISSRCSFEMVAKAAAFGAATLVAVSAPTSLALRARRRVRPGPDRDRPSRPGARLSRRGRRCKQGAAA